MKKRFYLILSIFMILFLASCNFNKTTDSEVLQKGYDVIVTFDANEGKIGNYETRYFYAKPNSYIFEPGNNTIDAPVRQGYVLDGWYRGTKDDNGVITFGDKFDFTHEKVTESITLYAKWGHYYTYRIVYGEDDQPVGTEIKKENPDEVVSKPEKNPTRTGYTFFGYYEDKELTKEFDWSKLHEFDENQVCKIYTKWLDGTYILASTAADLKTINSTTNIYLLNDIDCTGVTTSINATEYKGKIVGNGHTISNMTVNYSKQSGISDCYYGLFKKLNGACITNVTFDNVKITAKFGAVVNNYYFGLFAGDIRNSTISNVTIKNSSLTLDTDLVDSDSTKFNIGKLYGSKDKTNVDSLYYGENNSVEFKKGDN